MFTLNNKGFTVVELLIVIVVIGILAAVGYVGYNGVTTRANDTKSQSTLSKAQDFIESKDISSGLYPASLTGFTGDAGVTLTYVPSSNRKTYCLSASNVKTNTKSYKVQQEGRITEGTCVEPPFDGPDPGTFVATTCVPGQYAPDTRPYTTVSFESEPQSVYPSFNMNVYIYDSSGSSLDTINDTGISNYLSSFGEFEHGLGVGYVDAAELEIEVEYVKPNGSASSATLNNVPNNVVYQASCSGYQE